MNARLAQRYHSDGMSVTPGPQLVVKLYERLLLDLRRAVTAVDEGSIEASHEQLVHAQDIVFELNLALDVDAWDGGPGLRAIYEHLSAKLVEANVQKSAVLVGECIEVVEPLVEAWQEALVITQTDRQAVAAVPVRAGAGYGDGSPRAGGLGPRGVTA